MAKNSRNITLPSAVFMALSDADLSKDIFDALKNEYDFTNVKQASVGEVAWAALKDGDFDFVVLDWKLDKVSGLVLFNRLRQSEKYQNVPILVISGLIQKENFVLIKDYPFTELVDGQYTESVFILKFESLQKEVTWFKANNTALDGIVAVIRDDPPKAKTQLDELIKSAPNPLPLLNFAARKFRELELYKEAEALLDEAMKSPVHNSLTVMEMAKIYHFTGRHKEALALVQGHKFSMKNIERLLLIGEINLAEKQPDEARKIFASALEIDQKNETAKSGVLVADNMKNFLSKNDATTLPKSFASMLNLVAISLVKSGKQDEGVAQYKAALAFIHDNLSQARLMYNLGLGYLRWSKKDEALTWFEQSAKVGGSAFPKAGEYVNRLKKKTGDIVGQIGDDET